MSTDTAKRICLFGPQGSGKGTQAEKLSEYAGIPHLSPGNMFRTAVAEGNDLGKKVEEIMNSGQLVPDEITNEVIRARLEAEDCMNGFILDGYPRNEVQADAMDSMTPLTHVLVIHISDEESIRRISNRRVCSDCGATYHLDYKKSATAGVCDACGHELIQREDDTPDAIQKRLNIYHEQTEPLFSRYEERGIFHRIDGTPSIDEVWANVQEVINSSNGAR